ncbi:MAG: hypothetical protein ACKV2Q_30060 [Planctomycetaceae bacterium]
MTTQASQKLLRQLAELQFCIGELCRRQQTTTMPTTLIHDAGAL